MCFDMLYDRLLVVLSVCVSRGDYSAHLIVKVPMCRRGEGTFVMVLPPFEIGLFIYELVAIDVP